MELRERDQELKDEVLEVLWTELVEGGLDSIDSEEIILGEHGPADIRILTALAGQGMINLEENKVALTDSGFEEARKTIRRHRLSERLFHDVFEIQHDELESPACRFEHMLIRPKLEKKICELLGHPKTCPHNRPIPVGDCCHRAEMRTDKAVVSMSKLRQGEHGVIAYVHTGDSEKLKKLMAMGILPGEELSLERRFPSFVFRVGYSRFAVDEGMAEGIFVRRTEEEQPGEAETVPEEDD